MLITWYRQCFPMLIAVLLGNGWAQTSPGEPPRTAQVSGRIVDAKGNAIQIGGLSLVPLDPRDPAGWLTAVPGSDGSIAFYDVPAKKYRVTFLGDELFKIVPAQLAIDPGKRIQLGDIIVQQDVRPNLTRSQIVVDPLAISTDSPFLEPILKHQSASSWCSLQLDHFKSVQDFLGGKVRTIRVLRAVQIRGLGRLTPADVQTSVLEAWVGIFRDGSCSIDWDEVTFWTIAAIIEYEDGKRTLMMFDSSRHLSLEDREGRVWFIRLWPYG